MYDLKDTIIYIGDEPTEWKEFYYYHLPDPEGKEARQWWFCNEERITLICQGGITASFKYTEEFYDKYLKNLEPSVDSPFKVSEVGE